MNISQFIAKWRKVELTERSAAQQHFLDLCEVFDHPKPAEADPTGEWFTFEKGASKHGGGEGWADVWKRGFFGWEYKGRHKDLKAAYDQLLMYREALENPPLLVVCDMDRMEVHTNFTATATVIHQLHLEELDSPRNLEILRFVFHQPDKLRPGATSVAITTKAAGHIAEIAQRLRERGLDAHDVSHFLDRIVFCMFAEDIGLLPEMVFTQVVKKTRDDPVRFSKLVGDLFVAMAHGGDFGAETIRHFNGNLFDEDRVLDLKAEEIEAIFQTTQLDWSSVDPSIFGTLFERGMDPAKRSQLGAHYTSREDIEALVEPVVMEPLRREWKELRETVERMLTTGSRDFSSATKTVVGGIGDPAMEGDEWRVTGALRQAQDDVNPQSEIRNPKSSKLSNRKLEKVRSEADVMLHQFLTRLGALKVLDPACGSGNFLYVTLQKLKDLEKEVIVFAMEQGIGGYLPLVGPWQLYGIEISPYAFDLAQMTVWIGYLQWTRANGFGVTDSPILRPSNNIQCRDAILNLMPEAPVVGGIGDPANAVIAKHEAISSLSKGIASSQTANGAYRNDGLTVVAGIGDPGPVVTPTEPEWPRVDCVVGNPPFLGDKLMRRELGDEYVDNLRSLYANRIPGQSDLCCYWFEKARQHVADGKCKRAGLLATQGIRGGANREVLKRIKESGDIFFAESDRPWILDGANVHVSMVGFDAGIETNRYLDGTLAQSINANLSLAADVTQGRRLPENLSLSFLGSCKGGAFDILETEALSLLNNSGNPHGKPNSDVVRPVVNSEDLMHRTLPRWIIDNAGLDLSEASLYELPHGIVEERVKPARDINRDRWLRENWWRPQRMRPEMRERAMVLDRFIVTTTTSKHRIFLWLKVPTLPDHQLIVFARSDDYFFGVLHSRVHEVWARAQGTQLRERESGFRYTPTTCFETFPFPKPKPEQEATIAEAARELNELRENWLNPPEWTREEVLEFSGSKDGPWARYVHDPDARGIGIVRYPRIVAKDTECAAKLSKRTLTNLYNQRPTWLDLAHCKLDEAVFAAYDWNSFMSDEDLLAGLLELNLSKTGCDV